MSSRRKFVCWQGRKYLPSAVSSIFEGITARLANNQLNQAGSIDVCQGAIGDSRTAKE